MRAWQRYTLISVLKELGFDNDMIQAATDKINSQMPDADGFIEISVRVEKHSDQLYAYRKDTDEFLAQGQDIEQLKVLIGQKVRRSVRLIITDEDGADLVR